MASSKTDFEYDSKDISLLRVSLEKLKEEDSRGFRLGCLSGLGFFFLIRKKTHFSRGASSIFSLIGAVTIYNLYTHDARDNYARLASLSNRNASVRLNQMMG